MSTKETMTPEMVLHDLEARYHRLHARYQQVREGHAVWRQYNRQTNQFESYAEAMGEIEDKLQAMQQTLQTSTAPLIFRMEIAESPTGDIPLLSYQEAEEWEIARL